MPLEGVNKMIRDWGRFTPKVYNPDRARNPIQNGPTHAFQVHTYKHIPRKI
jgi:hypothetical protein